MKEPNFNDTNIRILWCAAWNQAATIMGGIMSKENLPDFPIAEKVENIAYNLFDRMYKPYASKEEPQTLFADSANDLLGEYPDSMNPPRKDKRVDTK